MRRPTTSRGRRVLNQMLASCAAVALTATLGGTAAATFTSPVYAQTAARSAAVQKAAVPTGTDHVDVVRGRNTWKVFERVVPTKTGPNRDIAVDIDTALYVPSNASAKHPQPAILMTHGFGLTKDSAEVVSTAQFYAAHGYVVLTYTSAGFGSSGGCVTLQSMDYDVRSARQVISKVLGRRKDVLRDRRGPIVGTIGGSYGGGIQLPLAAADKRIRTAIPGRTWNLLQYSLDPNNRVAPGDPTGFTHQLNDQGVFKLEWTSLFYGLGNAQPAQGNGGCPEAKAASSDPVESVSAGACPGYYLALCETYSKLAATGDAGDAERLLIGRASGATFLDKVDVPVMLVQGQSDTLFNLNDAVSTFTTLKRRGVPVAMIWNSGGHGGYTSQPGECEAYDGATRSVAAMDHCYLSLRQLGWMDHWLRGTKAGRGPAFTWYRDWVAYDGKGPDDEQYGAADTFPLTQGTTFTLSGTDALAAPGEDAEASTVSLFNPGAGSPAAYTETSNFSGPESSPSMADLEPQEVDGQFAAFTTAPLSADVDVVGVPSARLRITNTNGQDMVFFAKAYDVAPDGSATLIHRLIAPVRVPADAVSAPVRLKLAGFAHRFAAGHAMRLVLCTTDQTSYNAKAPDLLVLSTGSGSTFTMPTLAVPRFAS